MRAHGRSCIAAIGDLLQVPNGYVAGRSAAVAATAGTRDRDGAGLFYYL